MHSSPFASLDNLHLENPTDLSLFLFLALQRDGWFKLMIENGKVGGNCSLGKRDGGEQFVAV